MDRLSTRTDSLLRKEIYSYDLNGNLITFSDRKGRISRFGYDGLNRRISSIFDDGTRTEFVYDGAGRLTTVTDTVSGPITFAYDNLDRLTSEAIPLGIVSYGYDAIGRRTSMSANGGTPVTYSYDAASRLTQVAQGTQIVGLGYDAAGRRTTLTYPNSVTTSYSYDQASRTTQILHQSVSSIIENLTYTYDAAGNRISFSRTGPQADLPRPVQAAYDAANEQIQFNSTTPNLMYDSNGNLISQADANGTTTYSWDARNRLVGLNRTVIASNSEAISASFTYDALGRRTSKTINGVTTQYIYDRYNIVAEIQNGVIEATYLRGLRIDEAFVRQTSSNEYYHTDALGSVMGLTDQTGAMQTTYSYDPFGNTAITGTSANPFQYTGRENDGTGLYYYRARYYSPRLQRFISEDPIRLLGGINFYRYVRNNPLRFKDPLGLEHDTLWPWVPDENEPDYTPEEAQEVLFHNIDVGIDHLINDLVELGGIIAEHASEAILDYFLPLEFMLIPNTLEPPPAEAEVLPIFPPAPPGPPGAPSDGGGGSGSGSGSSGGGSSGGGGMGGRK